MAQYSLFILDDHPIVTEGLFHLLTKRQGCNISRGHNIADLNTYLTSSLPDVIIADYELNGDTALDILSLLKKKGLNIPVIIYTMHTEFWILKLLIKAEVAGIVIKGDEIEEISKSIDSVVCKHQKYYSPTALNTVLSIMGDHSAETYLEYVPSPRENEIIQMLSTGLTSEDISSSLNISKHTVDTIRKNILIKSGAINTSHLVRKAFIKGWIKE